MYLPAHFEERRPEPLHALMRHQPLATLVTLDAQGQPDANHIPLHLELGPGDGPLGRLCGHVARANPLWREAAAQRTEVLAIFHGPAAYISPAWYPSKAQDGRVVPTWNYVVVHAHGQLRAVDGDRAWLRQQLTALTAQQEAGLPHTPWQLDEAPADYLERMLGAIVGLELTVTRLVGKWKVSQNHSASNRAGVVAGLTAQGQHEAAACVPGTAPV